MTLVKNNIIFLNQATASGTSAVLSVPANVSPLAAVVVAISGSHASKTLAFEGQGENGGYAKISAKNLTTGSSASQTTGTATEIWSIPAMGLSDIRLNLIALGSGSVTAIGKLIC